MEKNLNHEALIAAFIAIPLLQNTVHYNPATMSQEGSEKLYCINAGKPNWYTRGVADLDFDSNWNQLMLAVDYINSGNTDWFVTIFANRCRIHCMYPAKGNDIDVEGSKTIEAVYQAVVQLIEFLNENN